MLYTGRKVWSKDTVDGMSQRVDEVATREDIIREAEAMGLTVLEWRTDVPDRDDARKVLVEDLRGDYHIVSPTAHGSFWEEDVKRWAWLPANEGREG